MNGRAQPAPPTRRAGAVLYKGIFMEATTQAKAAAIAVKNFRKWGAYAATIYAMKAGALRHLDQALAFERRRAIRRDFAGYLA